MNYQDDGSIIAEREFQRLSGEYSKDASMHAEALYQSQSSAFSMDASMHADLLGAISSSANPQGMEARLASLEERVGNLERAKRSGGNGLGSDDSPDGLITIDRYGAGGTIYGHTASGKKVMWSGVMGQGGKWTFV